MHKLADGSMDVSGFADEMQEKLGTLVRLMKETSRISDEEAQQAEAFKYSCVRRMHPFAQAQVDADPSQLDFQVEHFVWRFKIPGLEEVQDEIHDAESGLSLIRDIQELVTQEDGYGDNLLLRFSETCAEMRLWALRRTRTKIYAKATLPEME